MLLKYFYDKKLAQASYMVGCAETGEALVIDPARDIKPYLEAAQDENLRITHVTETHIHADYVSGSRELVNQTGAKLYLSDMGDDDWKYGYADDQTILLRGGDSWMVGNIKVDVLHTPGHTPEHICFMITDTLSADQPIGVFTGDFLFVGDVGRPDLLEEAAGIAGTKDPGARQQFHSVQRFKLLPDYLQIWPGHGAGSACGKALGALPSTTLGYEKLFNPAFQIDNEDDFADWLLDGQPEAPRYFAQMKQVNKTGPALLETVAIPAHLTRRAELDAALERGDLVLDMRSLADFRTAHIPSTLNVPNTYGGCVSYVGWFVNYDGDVYLIADADAVESIVTNLRSIGVDNIKGYFTPEVIEMGETASLPFINAAELAQKLDASRMIILDVRGANEYETRHIAGAKHITLGYLPEHLDELPKDSTIVTQCASGHRSQIAASLLRKHGFTNVLNLTDGVQNWSQALPTEQG
jgi:hydroxyacylglutathione hydrolase